MIGDSITDLKSGHSAGMPVVLMEYGYTENIEMNHLLEAIQYRSLDRSLAL